MFQLHTLSDLSSLSAQQTRHRFGGKLLGLYEAHRIGITIPSTWAVGTEAHAAFLESHPSEDLEEFRAQATAFIRDHFQPLSLEAGSYAVRSSSQGEDASSHSYAGIFETKLNVPKGEVAEAIAFVWSSLLLEKAKSYRRGSQLMGVIIQPMVEAKFAGICFTTHPSPSAVFENKQLVVEFAEASGEKIVGGEVIPYRLVGTADMLSAVSEYGWMDDLLMAIFELKKHYHHEADIEFAIDQNHRFWLLQQRPISKVYPSHTLDLSKYKRMYKRSLLSLDIELLIDGCSRFLAAYLEIPIHLERWMVMTTNAQGIQELWVDQVLNETVLRCVIDKIEHDPTYLSRIEARYADHFDRLKGPQPSDLFKWFEWMTPLAAHYYVPMFLVDALYTAILREIRHIDHEQAENDLFTLSTMGIASLVDLLNSELLPMKGRGFEECKEKLDRLAERFGFLKCRQPFDPPYSSKELYEMVQEVPAPEAGEADPIETDAGKKYFKQPHLVERLMHLREWMRIRNQEMEYLLFAYLGAQPMIDAVCKELAIDSKTFWQSSKRSLLSGSPTQIPAPIIVQAGGQTEVTDTVEVQLAQVDAQVDLKGQTVYGTGVLEAVVHVAFSPDEIEPPKTRPAALVTGMTTPDFVPLLRKHFDVLITDEGGILCHAAIIAREIPIPCVVGTGRGSDLLKDGMKVKIDLGRGEISKA